jgi:glycosyltransferase involved in cell wall biosynthesis
MRPALSLCMVVRNEERNLQACLDSAEQVFGELIVVDTGSTDATPDIAARNGALVIPFDFAFVDFAAARNRSLSATTNNWILVLDADERLGPGAVPLIQELLARNENAGYYVERHNPAGIDYAVRLFPNRFGYRYCGRVHETVDASILAGGGRLCKSAIRLDHAVSSEGKDARRKNRWYIQILEEEIAADPSDHTRLDFLAAEYHQLEMFDEAAAVAERITLARPLDPTAHLNAGIYHLVYQSKSARARADFEQALKLRPGYPEALSFLETINSGR